ncbi:MAG: TonB-dependent receptor [Lewinella sp.]|nr:TonB-dependent receptor [Lewinella sp.]
MEKPKVVLALLFALLVSSVYGQQIQVSGQVVSGADQLPLIGATVLRVGTSDGVITDFDGQYAILVSPGDSLEFSYTGYASLRVPVAGRNVVDVTLQESSYGLEQVVVIGYGTQKKALVTGSSIEIDNERIVNQNRTNVLEALQGQTPGVQITSTSGQPGSALDVVIRGQGSTGGSGPLYVVDGVLTGDISYLNPTDIESISVLKDAASAAIYGSQASNGVVIVTTKGGQSGQSQVTFDSYYGVQNVAQPLDMLNAEQYAIIMNEAALNSGSQRFFSDEEIAALGDGTNWIDRMFVDDAKTQNYVLGFSGGSAMSNFSSSFAYTTQEGVVGGADLSNYERFNFRFNSSHKMLNDRLTIGENLTFAYINSNGIGVGNQYNNSLRGAFNTNPLVPYADENGDFYNTSGDAEPWLAGQSNPYATMVYGNQNQNNSQKLLGNAYADVKILPDLTFHTSLGLDYYANEGHSFTPLYELSVYAFNNFTRVNQSAGKGFSLLWDNLLTYDLNLNQAHDLKVMVGTSAYRYQGTYIWANNVDLIFNDLEHSWLDNALNTDGNLLSLGGGPNNENKRLSYFGRVSYSYRDKFLLNATYRADGSSNFAKDNRWGYFPSVSAGWILSNEGFLTGNPLVSFLKLRASWGQVGNQNVGAFQFLAPITFANTNYIFGSTEGVLTPGAYPSRLANPELQWETSEQINFGVDAKFMDYRLGVTVDLYKKTNKDWLILAPILATAGADAPYINGGDVTNTGIELGLTYDGNLGDFNYSIGFNGAYNKNEVGNIPTADGIIHGETNQIYDNAPEFYRAQSGFPLGFFWGYETAGVYQDEGEIFGNISNGQVLQPKAKPGDIIYVDQNGDGVLNDQDKVMIGDPNPDFTLGFNVGFEFKGLDFSVYGVGVAGNQIAQSYRNQASQFANHTTAVFDRWTGPGSSDTYPRVTLDNRNWVNFSDLYIQDGDFLRISNITLGYDLTKAFPHTGFAKLRVYASALNYFTFTRYNGMDPEVGYGISSSNYAFSSGVDLGYYPRPKTLLFGLNITL